jgi:hypothetical protein
VLRESWVEEKRYLDLKLASQNEGIKYKIDTLSGLISFYDKLKSEYMSLLPKLKWVNMNDSK